MFFVLAFIYLLGFANFLALITTISTIVLAYLTYWNISSSRKDQVVSDYKEIIIIELHNTLYIITSIVRHDYQYQQIQVQHDMIVETAKVKLKEYEEELKLSNLSFAEIQKKLKNAELQHNQEIYKQDSALTNNNAYIIQMQSLLYMNLAKRTLFPKEFNIIVARIFEHFAHMELFLFPLPEDKENKKQPEPLTRKEMLDFELQVSKNLEAVVGDVDFSLERFKKTWVK